MLGLPEAVADANEADREAARIGDDRAGGLGYLALQLAQGSAAPIRTRSRRPRRRAASTTAAIRPCAASTSSLGGASAGTGLRCRGGGGRGERWPPGPGERWLHGYVRITSALALYRQPERRPECADAAGEALRALQDLGDPVGTAYALDVLGWLAADDGRFERSAWLLGAAQAHWELTGSRLGGDAGLEGHRARSARPPPACSAPGDTRSCTPGGLGISDPADRRARTGGRPRAAERARAADGR